MRNYCDYLKEIPFLRSSTESTKITLGSSGDGKYVLKLNEKLLLLRVQDANIKDRADKSLKYKEKYPLMTHFMEECYSAGVRLPRVYDGGYINEYDEVYIITDYLEGEALQHSSESLSNLEQYSIGFELGVSLKRMYQLSTPMVRNDWKEYILNPMYSNHNLYVEKKENLPMRMDQEIENTLFSFIQENKYLLDEVNCVRIHNDVHDGNVIHDNGTFKGLIDFTEFTLGDIEYDNKLLNHSTVLDTPYFAAGVLHGKYGEVISDDTWRKIYLYIAIDILKYNPLAHLGYFTLKDAEEEFKVNRVMFQEMNGFAEFPPKWYSNIDLDAIKK